MAQPLINVIAEYIYEIYDFNKTDHIRKKMWSEKQKVWYNKTSFLNNTISEDLMNRCKEYCDVSNNRIKLFGIIKRELDILWSTIYYNDYELESIERN